MIGLIQRVSSANVRVDGEIIGEISRGILLFLAVQPEDGEQNLRRMVERVLQYRIFPDEKDRMNKSLLDEGLQLLVVPQFTLAADTRKGNRPSFTRAANPEMGRRFFDAFLEECRSQLGNVQSGRFGADMQVSLTNDGPVTFWLEA